ncbi:MAG: hypothetical protein A2156_03470 [Deltaproteobacteria bacterium RBG_16_48_10]|nr:MAG: hypothetical protein A2156_03470 [Deltaproteobacteria bacterium RBG_16_48_10]
MGKTKLIVIEAKKVPIKWKKKTFLGDRYFSGMNLNGLVKTPRSVTLAPFHNGVNSSRSPDVVPANAGNQNQMNLSCLWRDCFRRKERLEKN